MNKTLFFRKFSTQVDFMNIPISTSSESEEYPFFIDAIHNAMIWSDTVIDKLDSALEINPDFFTARFFFSSSINGVCF